MSGADMGGQGKQWDGHGNEQLRMEAPATKGTRTKFEHTTSCEKSTPTATATVIAIPAAPARQADAPARGGPDAMTVDPSTRWLVKAVPRLTLGQTRAVNHDACAFPLTRRATDVRYPSRIHCENLQLMKIPGLREQDRIERVRVALAKVLDTDRDAINGVCRPATPPSSDALRRGRSPDETNLTGWR